MTSKTFKSALNPTELEVGTYTDSQVVLAIGYEDGEDLGVVYLAPSDAPALALAILEAAGGRDSLGIDVGNAIIDLREYVTEQERITAKVKDKAELEAEALDLFNLWLAGFDYECYSEWTRENAELKVVWLAVARKAREMRAEK